MALSGFRREEAAKSAFGRLGGSDGRLSDRDIAGGIIQKFGGVTDFGDQISILNIVRQQRRAFEAGDAMQSGPGSAAPTPTINDWTLFSELNQFGYHVRVFATDPNTGERIEQLHVVGSDTPLTADQARARAEADFLRTAPQHSTNPTQLAVIQGRTITSEIVSIGRRP